MRAEAATGLLRRANASEELMAVMRCVFETTTQDGTRKYSLATSNTLAKLIVRRSFDPSIVQLCHLINLLDARANDNERYERLLFAPTRSTPSAWRAHIGQALASPGLHRQEFAHDADEVVIEYTDGVVAVPYRRMPLLGQIYEFLIATLPYEETDRIIRAMLIDSSRTAPIEAAAEDIGVRLRNYLAVHLPSRRMQAKHYLIQRFLGRREEGSGLDDDAVRDYWLVHSGKSGESEFRTFRSIFEAFVEFALAIDANADREAMDLTPPTIAGRRPGDAELLADTLTRPDAHRAPLDAPAAEPARRLKFLTKREMNFLSPLLRTGPWARRLPLSLLRSEVFGAIQARIAQASRKGASPEVLGGLIACTDAEPYTERRRHYRQLQGHIRLALEAAAYATLRREIAASSPGAGGEADRPDAADDERRRIEHALRKGQQAFKAIRRQGFDEAGIQHHYH